MMQGPSAAPSMPGMMAQGGGAMPDRTPDDVVPAAKPPEDLVDEVRRALDRAFQHDRTNREEAITDLKFVAGDQWPEFARQQRVNRPMLTINKIPAILHQVTNDIRQNAPVMKVTPVGGQQDEQMADVFNGIISDIQYRSSARHVYANAAYHSAACGIGHWRIITKYTDDDSFDQDIAIDLVPYPLAVYWDPASVKPDRSDAMWCIVVDLVPRETFKDKYPNAAPVSVDAMVTNNFASGLFWTTQDYVLVAEYWVKRPIERTLLAFQNGQSFDVTGLNMQQLYQLQMQLGQPVKQRKAKGYKVEQSLVTGAEVLSGPNSWPGKYIPVVPVVGEEVPQERMTVRKGLVRDMRDPQQLYNYYRSAAAEHIALSPKSPWLLTAKMLAQNKAQWDSANTRNRPYLMYDYDSNVPEGPKRVNAPEPPAALWQEQQVASQDMKDVSGIHEASLGARSNETSGKAIIARQKEGDNSNFHYTDNLTRSLEQTGRIIVDLIPKVYDNERVVRLMTDDGSEQFAPINTVLYAQNGVPVMVNDLSQARYDIRVVTGPSYATRRLEAMDAMLSLMDKMGPASAPVLADLIVKNADWPDSQEAAKRLHNMVPPQALRDPNAPPPNPMDNPELKAKIAKDFATAHKTMEDANAVALESQAMFGMMQPPLPPNLPPEVMPAPPPMPPPGMPGQPPQQMPQGAKPPGGNNMLPPMPQNPMPPMPDPNANRN